MKSYCDVIGRPPKFQSTGWSEFATGETPLQELIGEYANGFTATNRAECDSSLESRCHHGVAIAFGWVLILLGSGHQITNVRDYAITIVVKWAVVAILGVLAFGVHRRRSGDFGAAKFSWSA